MKYFDFSSSLEGGEGGNTFRRLNCRQPIGDLVVPHADMETMGFIDPAKLGHLLVAGCAYALDGHCTLPANAADMTPLLIKIINASEAAVDHRITVSKAGQTGAAARWGTRTDAELEHIDLPEIIIPAGAGLMLPDIRSGGFDISPEEYLQAIEIFFIRGFEQGQYLSFYSYYGRKHWLEGSIDTREARLNRAMRWNQLDGARRFDADPAAHTFLRELLTILPANKRIYLLGEGVTVCADSTGHVCISAPTEIKTEIMELPKAIAALDAYRLAHNLSNDEWGFISIPFLVRTSRR